MPVKFIYFDVGGVAILDFSKTNKWGEMLSSLGLHPQGIPKFNELFDSEETKYCLGEKEVNSFINVLKREFKLELPDSYSFLNDFVNRFEPNPTLASIVMKLKETYKVGLLTNMYIDMLDAIKKRDLLPHIEWDVIVDSSKVHLVKPQMEIFRLAEKMANVSGEEILFVENSEKHVTAAMSAGWKTLLYDPANVAVSNLRLLEVLER